jgi:TetR/AcrR family transcriptional regulator, acrAB operon repressor
MARSTKEEAVETRNRILDAAEDVFHAQGVARTSLADVAHAANVTRGAIYWHFKNKSDLFNAMCHRVRQPMEAMLETNAEEGNTDPLGQLRSRLIFVLQEVADNPHTRKVFGILCHKCEFLDAADFIFARQKEGYMEWITNIEQTLREAMDRKQLPQDLDVMLARISIHASFTGLLNNWLFAPESFNLMAHAEQIIDASIDALRYAPTLRRRNGH